MGEEIVAATAGAIDRLFARKKFRRVEEATKTKPDKTPKPNWDHSTFIEILCYGKVAHVHTVDVKLIGSGRGISRDTTKQTKETAWWPFFLVSNVNRGKPVWMMDQVESRHCALTIFFFFSSDFLVHRLKKYLLMSGRSLLCNLRNKNFFELSKLCKESETAE